MFLRHSRHYVYEMCPIPPWLYFFNKYHEHRSALLFRIDQYGKQKYISVGYLRIYLRLFHARLEASDHGRNAPRWDAWVRSCRVHKERVARIMNLQVGLLCYHETLTCKILFCKLTKLLFFTTYSFFFAVLIKKDFPFANVPVPKVTYVNDNEPQVTLNCSIHFPTWNNVSFEVQWFVNGRGVTPTQICDNPNESRCNQREFHLGTLEYKPGDTVIIHCYDIFCAL